MRANVHTPTGVKSIEIADPPPPLIANLFVHCGTIVPSGVAVYRSSKVRLGRTCAEAMPPRERYPSDGATLIPYAGRE
jgi:hypothetical protein